jgi:DNA-binding NarL/FixJ family response regulator
MSSVQIAGAERRRPITVVLVDDQVLIRSILSRAMSSAGLSVIGEASSGEEAIAIVLDLRPDVVLMDLGLPGIDGVEAIGRLGMLAPASRILVLTGSNENRVVEAIVAGASGYLLKDTLPEAIVSAVRATAGGESVLSPRVAGKLLQRIREREILVTATSENAAVAIRAALTGRELEIFQRLASGQSNQTIAEQLCVSPNTVSNHIASILTKLHLENRIQAAVQAVRSGIS